MKNRILPIKYFLIVCGSVIHLMAHPSIGQSVNFDINKFAYSKTTYTYKIVDGHEIQADIYRYPSEEVQPVIIWIHGGALIFGTRNWLPSDQLEQYLKADYTVVSIDYRLAPETKLKAIIEDLEDAYAWVYSKGPELFNINPNRIAVVGHSAGGYLTLMAGFRLNPRPTALVSFYGYGDITGPWYSQADPFYNQLPSISRDQAFDLVGNSTVSNPQPSNKRSDFYLYCRQNGLWPKEVSGHNPVEELEWFFDYEPLRNITSEYPPTVLLHGEKDTDVPHEQSVLMSKAFEHHKIDYEFITNSDWGHGFDNAGMKDPSVQEAFNNILKFLDEHLK